MMHGIGLTPMLVKVYSNTIVCLWFGRFKDGLSTLGVMDAMMVYPEAFRPVFCVGHDPVTAAIIDQLFKPVLSEDGSNKRAIESVILTWWKDFILDLAGNFT